MWKVGPFDAVLHRRWRGQSDGLVGLRGRPAGGGRKPPRVAAVKSRDGERRGARRALSVSGVGQEDERERSTDDVSKSALDDIETGRPTQPGMSLAGVLLIGQAAMSAEASGRRHDEDRLAAER